MPIPKDYRKQDGCWNCDHRFKYCGEYHCNVENLAPSAWDMGVWHEWCAAHEVSGEGYCGRYAIAQWARKES